MINGIKDILAFDEERSESAGAKRIEILFTLWTATDNAMLTDGTAFVINDLARASYRL
jgi:hypothetical protein